MTPQKLKPAQCCIKLVFYLTYTTMRGKTEVKIWLYLYSLEELSCHIKGVKNYLVFLSDIEISPDIWVMYVYHVIRSVYFTHTSHQDFELLARSV